MKKSADGTLRAIIMPRILGRILYVESAIGFSFIKAEHFSIWALQAILSLLEAF